MACVDAFRYGVDVFSLANVEGTPSVVLEVVVFIGNVVSGTAASVVVLYDDSEHVRRKKGIRKLINQ